MATREEIADALRKAHAAGNTEQAQILAQAIIDMDAQAPQKAPQQADSFQGTSYLKNLANMGAQGATMGTSDELGAMIAKPAVYALKNLLPESMGGEAVTYDQAGQLVDMARGNVESERKQFQTENPVASTAAMMAGGLPMMMGTAGLANAAAPKATAALANFAARNPYTATAGLGGVQGELYGIGAGEGDLGKRAAEAAPGAGVSALLSLPLLYAGRNVAAPLARKGGSALSRLNERFGGASRQAPDQIDDTLRTVADLKKSNGDFFSKTAGERGQVATVQQREAGAIAGQYGDEAANLIRSARNTQNQERLRFIKALNEKVDTGETVEDVLDSVYERVSKSASSLGKEVDNAYDIARQGNSVKISSGDLRTGLMSRIGQIRRDMALNLSDANEYGKSRAVLKALGKKISRPDSAKVTSVKLGDLEDWRKTLTNYANDARGSEKRFLGQVREAYDDFMIKTANEAADSGDEAAIKAFRNAVSLRRKYGEIFERNNIVEAVSNGKSVDDFTKDLIGAGKILGRKGSSDNVKAIIKAGGNESDLVKDDLATAFMKRAFERAQQGTQEGMPDVPYISPVKLANELDQLFVKNRTVAKELYGDEAAKAVRQAIKELRLMGQRQPSTQNPSGSAEMVLRALRESGIMRLPGLASIQEMARTSAQAGERSQLAKGLAEFVDLPTKPKSNLFTLRAGSSGAIIGSDKGE